MKTLRRLFLVSLAVWPLWSEAKSTPLRIEQTIEPRFPPELALSTLREGEARVVVNIDANGQLVDWLVTGYSDRAFADEAVTVLKAWRYEAPRDDGQPVGVRTELRFQFEAKGRVISLTAIETTDILLKQVGVGPMFTRNVCLPQELDRPLTPVSAATPLYPAPSAATNLAKPHSVVVDFYVDAQGVPRMPVVVNEAHAHFASAAVDALTRWRFTAPTRSGKPIAVRVRQEFVFPGRS
jgi:TonB family protein